MSDIPLSEAILTAKGLSPRIYPISVKVVRYSPDMNLGNLYDYTCGADHSSFRAKTENWQLREIFVAKWVLIKCDEVPEQSVHKALTVIPEYRREMRRLKPLGRKWPERLDPFMRSVGLG